MTKCWIKQVTNNGASLEEEKYLHVKTPEMENKSTYFWQYSTIFLLLPPNRDEKIKKRDHVPEIPRQFLARYETLGGRRLHPRNELNTRYQSGTQPLPWMLTADRYGTIEMDGQPGATHVSNSLLIMEKTRLSGQTNFLADHGLLARHHWLLKLTFLTS